MKVLTLNPALDESDGHGTMTREDAEPALQTGLQPVADRAPQVDRGLLKLVTVGDS